MVSGKIQLRVPPDKQHLMGRQDVKDIINGPLPGVFTFPTGGISGDWIYTLTPEQAEKIMALQDVIDQVRRWQFGFVGTIKNPGDFFTTGV